MKPQRGEPIDRNFSRVDHRYIRGFQDNRSGLKDAITRPRASVGAAQKNQDYGLGLRLRSASGKNRRPRRSRRRPFPGLFVISGRHDPDRERECRINCPRPRTLGPLQDHALPGTRDEGDLASEVVARIHG